MPVPREVVHEAAAHLGTDDSGTCGSLKALLLVNKAACRQPTTRRARAAASCEPVLRSVSSRTPFRSTTSVVEVHDSARKHGVVDEDIHHAIDQALAIEDAGEDPDLWLVIGPDRAGNLLEVVVLTTVEDTRLAIHAMPMRARFGRLLES